MVITQKIFTPLACLILPALAALMNGPAASSTLLYSNSLEDGYGDVHFAGGCYSFSKSIVDSPVRDGLASLLLVNDGTKPCEEPSGELKHRVEVRWGANTTYSELNTPYWYAFSVFVPNDFPTAAQVSGAVIVAQWMGGSYGPELSFQIRDGSKWQIRRDWSTGVGDTGHEMTQAESTVERGVWTDWVVYRERSWNSDGVLKVWKNGEKIVDFVGPTAINYVALGNGGNIQFKNGIYWGTTPRSAIYMLYFDDIRTTDAADGFGAAEPDAGAEPTPPSTLTLISP